MDEQLAERDGSADTATRVMIVDDHHMFADLLAMALDNEADFEIVGNAACADAAVETAARTRPDMVVMDIQLGGQDGLEATRRIRALRRDTVVVVISAHRDPSWIAKAVGAGASAFAPKSGSLSEILSILRRARNGAMLVAPSLFRPPPPNVARQPQPSPEPKAALTFRERDVLALMGKGAAPVQIARVLDISVHTCRGYVKSIHAKLGARSQLEAVIKAQCLGLLEPAE